MVPSKSARALRRHLASTPGPEDIYAKLYCARGQAENLI